MSKLPHPHSDYRISQEERLLLEAYTRLHLADTAQLAQVSPDSGLCHELDHLLSDLTALLSQLSNVLTQHYFTHVQPPRQFAAMQSDFLT